MEITIVTKGNAFSIVTDVLERHGLSVVSLNSPSRTIVASGRADAIGKMLGIRMQERETTSGPQICYEGEGWGG